MEQWRSLKDFKVGTSGNIFFQMNEIFLCRSLIVRIDFHSRRCCKNINQWIENFWFFNLYFTTLGRILFRWDYILKIFFFIFHFQNQYYRAFHRFGQAKFPNGGSVLDSSQFSILLQLPPKTMLGLKVVKIDSKVSNLLR